jgi:hypothetical protein
LFSNSRLSLSFKQHPAESCITSQLNRVCL